jgi:hypothetical protein
MVNDKSSVGEHGEDDACETRHSPENDGKQLHRQELSVDPFGSLKLLTSECHVKIVSVDAQKYPEMDRLVCLGASGIAIEITQQGKEVTANICDEPSSSDKDTANGQVNFEVPIKFGKN